jgi:hypothetical protein
MTSTKVSLSTAQCFRRWVQRSGSVVACTTSFFVPRTQWIHWQQSAPLLLICLLVIPWPIMLGSRSRHSIAMNEIPTFEASLSMVPPDFSKQIVSMWEAVKNLKSDCIQVTRISTWRMRPLSKTYTLLALICLQLRRAIFLTCLSACAPSQKNHHLWLNRSSLAVCPVCPLATTTARSLDMTPSHCLILRGRMISAELIQRGWQVHRCAQACRTTQITSQRKRQVSSREDTKCFSTCTHLMDLAVKNWSYRSWNLLIVNLAIFWQTRSHLSILRPTTLT